MSWWLIWSLLWLPAGSHNGQSDRHAQGQAHGRVGPVGTQFCKITGAGGVHDLYLKCFGNDTPLPNLDWWKFE
jgi:hypothetical protein